MAVDATICNDAARIAEQSTVVLTFDMRQASAARSVGLSVIGG
jgi:hypothetical protein